LERPRRDQRERHSATNSTKPHIMALPNAPGWLIAVRKSPFIVTP